MNTYDINATIKVEATSEFDALLKAEQMIDGDRGHQFVLNL